MNVNLNQHVASVHEEKNPFKCKVCDYRYSKIGELIHHIELVHEERNPFKC